jgi:hypothetical protein
MTQVLALTRYGGLGASSRLRFLQYQPALGEAGVTVQISPLFDDEALSSRYREGRYQLNSLLGCYRRRVSAMRARGNFDLVWVEKECLPWAPLWLEQVLLTGVPYALDYDDAVFHNYDRHRLGIVRQLFGHRLDRLMAGSALVMGGNAYLVDRARLAGATEVAMLPTVIDLTRYPWSPTTRLGDFNGPLRIVWIGSPSTVYYLKALADPLRQLAARKPFVLRVIGATVEIPGVAVEHVAWTEATEVPAIAECDVGVMPLADSPWERGKCGYKLIQYMACGLPVVASPIGVNVDIVTDGVNGFLADGSEQWVAALERLLIQADLRRALGEQGRRRVESTYSLQVTAPILASLLKKAADSA